MRSSAISFSLPIAAILMLFCAGQSHAQMTVFLNFDTDWETNLNDAATAAGVDVFTGAEITSIETMIEADLNTIYSGTLLSFTTTSPGGSFTTIDLGATTGGGSLGVAPLDYFNLTVTQTASVFVANFDFILNEFSGTTDRSTQIDQIATALGGTSGHELGHSIGMHHHHSYSNAGITPSNYAATGGLQNLHVIATGSTGLSETERETLRSVSPWSKLILETAGGLDAGVHGFTGTALLPTVLAEKEFVSGGDVGDTTGTAEALGLGDVMPYSGYNQAHHAFSDLTSGDVDVFSIDIIGPGDITVEVVSASRWGSSFDTAIELIDTDGSTVLFSNLDGVYSGDTWGAGGSGVTDSFLINAPVSAAGTYFLRVSSESDFGDYSLIVGANTSVIPEPSSVALLLGISLAGFAYRRRRR